MKKSDPGYPAAAKRYCQMRADGKGEAEARKATGLSHVQGDYLWLRDERNTKTGVTFDPDFATLSEAEKDVYVAKLRAEEPQWSWGRITARIRMDDNEAEVKARFGAATGIAAEGTRSKRGGRWLKDDKRLYTGNRKSIGIEDKAPRKVDPEAIQATADKVKTVLPKRVAAAAKKAAALVKEEAQQD
jgi:hypothetical protein